MMKRGLHISVTGHGTHAVAVTQALGRLPGVAQVVQSRQPSPVCDLVVEMVGGVEPAFRTAMGALGSGIACVVTSPMLMAAHGRVLTAAAVGQHTFLGASALHFALPVEDILAVTQIRRIQLSFGSGAQAILARMGYRAESFSQAEAELRLQKTDLSDAGGKLTQARAMALLGNWRGVWPKLSASVRIGLDSFTPDDFKSLRAFGLQPVYGAVVGSSSVYTGPLAVAAGSPLLGALEREVMVLETPQGEVALSGPADEQARLVSGVVADVRRFMQRKPQMLLQAANVQELFSSQRLERCYVRVPYGQREMVLADVQDTLHERVEGNGFWQAVLTGVDVRELRLRVPEAMVMPMAGNWEVPAAGLRLIG